MILDYEIIIEEGFDAVYRERNGLDILVVTEKRDLINPNSFSVVSSKYKEVSEEVLTSIYTLYYENKKK